MSTRFRTGAGCLVVGPVLGLVSMLVAGSVSHHVADQAAAFAAHPVAEQLGLGLGSLAAVLLAGGLLWLALATHRSAPRLAVAGAVLGVLGIFSIVCDNTLHLAGAMVAGGHSATQGAALIAPLYSGGAVLVGPLSELADIGVILLAVAASRIGAPRWAVAVTCIGVLAEGAGFGVGTRYLAAVGFALTAIGFAGMLRTMHSPAAVPESGLATQHA